MFRYLCPGSPRGPRAKRAQLKMTRWYATEPQAMAGSSASSRRLAGSACGFAVPAMGVDVRKHQTTNPTIGRPTGLGGASSG